ncbi:hypothetical protein B7463_g3335, partial [Scytalidium lignicola]
MASEPEMLPSLASKSQNGTYTIPEQPLGSTRSVRIITIGAGASGINMIRTLRESISNYTHVVYEKNPQIGGTWYENRYPGCSCDIPAHNYQFSWRPNPEWSAFFAPAPEIERYLCQVCEEEGLLESIKTSHRVVGAFWNEDKRIWEVEVENLESGEIFNDFCHFLLDASGILNNWKLPDIVGLEDFQGDLIHSANWPEEFTYSGKKIAVIGNGSSGIQIVPTLQPEVKELVHFVRSPTWIAPTQQQAIAAGPAAHILQNVEMDGDKFTTQQIEKFKASPEYYLEFVKAVEQEINSKFPLLIKDSGLATRAAELLAMHMKATLGGDEHLSKALIPTFPVGCRRITPGVGYLSSLTEVNVRVVTEKIVRAVPNGIEIDTGEIIELDAIVCATGFDVSFRPRFPLVGQKANLQDLWTKNLPQAYMSCAVPEFPNYFKHVARYIVGVIQKCQTEGISSISPTETATRSFNEHIDAFMPRTAWAGTCRSWFKNGRETGPVTATHPGSRIHWFHMLEKFRGEDFEYGYVDGKRFSYLGNGFSTKELGDSDSTWYLEKLGHKL